MEAVYFYQHQVNELLSVSLESSLLVCLETDLIPLLSPVSGVFTKEE